MSDDAQAKPQTRPRGNRSGFRTLVGYHNTVWAGDGSEIVLEIGEQHMNSMGVVHGGVYATLLDAAIGHAVSWSPVPGHARMAVTLSLTTTYLASARAGRLRAVGRVIGGEGRFAGATAEVYDQDGRLCASAQASFLYQPGSERPEGVPLQRRDAARS
jgi:uncharacterized protein (TIGR00369 family)